MSTTLHHLPTLTTEEAEELLQHVARLAQAGFPLGAGLRAAADDCDSGRVALALRQLADRLDQGESLVAILENSAGWLPAHVAGLVVAALRTGRLGEALLELSEQQQAARTLRRGLRQALAYPLTVAILALVWLTALTVWLSHTFEQMFQSFGLLLPLATRLLFWWRDTGVWVLILDVVIIMAVAWIYRRRRGEAAWARFLTTCPIFGSLWHARALAEWTGLLNVLLKSQIPLPQALLWTGNGVRNAWVAQCTRRWAEQTAAGVPMSEALSAPAEFPGGLRPLIDWGERNGSLVEAIATARELLERRVRVRTELLQAILPAVLFAVVASVVLALVVALFMPIANLVRGLT